MPRIVGPTTGATPIDINVSGMSPHVVAYKLWWRDAKTEWTVIGEGSTGDQQPDHFQRPFTPGAQLFHWIGVGGNPNSNYQAIITLAQGGKALPNGLVDVSGQTNAKGVDTQQDWVSFI
jgi:hypothetical protein